MSIQHMQIVFDAGDLTAPQKAVLLAYCNFTDPHGYCWPGVERIADMTGLSVSGVKKVRKQLIEATLLTTVSRGKKGGGRKTNGSRINVKRLQKMKLPPRDYDDNLMPELGFEEDNEPEATGAKVPEGHTNGSPEAPQRYLGGTNEGTCGDPYPSVDPSGDPSDISSSVSGHAQREPAPAVAEKRKTKIETSSDIIKRRLADEDCTTTEADQIAHDIEAAGTPTGDRIKSLPTWVTNRDIAMLRGDLARVRGLQAPPAARTGDYWENQLRGERRARYAPGTGSYVDPDTVYTEDPKVVFGTSRTRPQDVTGALAPVVTAEQIRNGTDDFRL